MEILYDCWENSHSRRLYFFIGWKLIWLFPFQDHFKASLSFTSNKTWADLAFFRCFPPVKNIPTPTLKTSLCFLITVVQFIDSSLFFPGCFLHSWLLTFVVQTQVCALGSWYTIPGYLNVHLPQGPDWAIICLCALCFVSVCILQEGIHKEISYLFLNERWIKIL